MPRVAKQGMRDFKKNTKVVVMGKKVDKLASCTQELEKTQKNVKLLCGLLGYSSRA